MMNRFGPRLLLLILLAACLGVVTSSSSVARGEDSQETGLEVEPTWALGAATVDSTIQVESKSVDGKEIEVVHVPDGETIEIPVNLNAAEIRDSGLSPAQIAEAREEAREVLELTLRGVLSNDFGGTLVVGEDGQAVTLEVSQAGKKLPPENIFKRAFAFNHELYKPMPSGLTVAAKLKRFALMAWQFVLVETLHAGKDYYKQLRRVAPRFNEFGIALDFKIEPQIFIAKFNPTQKFKATRRNWAVYLEISYSRARHRVMLHTRFRKEKGDGGLGLPAVKAELKIFESDGTRAPYRGKAWYPISPPLLSFVLDSSEHYFAQGITIGFNSGDFVPGSTLTNTFTQFVQGQDTFKMVEVPQIASDALNRAAHKVAPSMVHLRAHTCSEIFR